MIWIVARIGYTIKVILGSLLTLGRMGIQEIQIWGVRAIMNQQFLQFAKTIGGRRSKGASVQSYLIYTILINSQKAMWGNIYQGKNFKNPWYILTIEVG